MKSNIRGYQRITANVFHIIGIFNMFFKFQKVYLNGFQSFRNFLINCPEFIVILKNKKSFTLSARSASVIASLYKQKVEFNLEKDLIIIKNKSGIISKNDKIVFYNAIENGDVYNVFINNEYSKLKVIGKTVVDVGANIGDSLIYFALNGAKRTIGFEPFYNNFYFAKKNIIENSLEEKCEVVLAGCSGKSGNIKLNPNMKSDVDSKLQSADKGEEIPLYSLHQIISDFNVPSKSILKMDCEGCEYDSIITASKESLTTFDEILLEYHYGYLDLKKKLESCGFRVTITTPISTGFIGKYLKIFKMKKENIPSKNNINNFKPGYSGMIHAIKINN